MIRRKFIGAGAAIVTGGAGLMGYATMIEPHWLEIVRRDLPVSGLPPALSGATLAHVSDIHACSYVDEGYLSRSLARLREMPPDIVVLTGDFVSWEEGRSFNRAAIALCHNPDAMDELPWDGYEGWVLSSHTHGGQCKPPFLPPPALPVKNRRYTSGEITAGSGRTLYISRGVGRLLKARFNVRPEITVFTLRTA